MKTLYKDMFNEIGFCQILNNIDSELVSSFTDDVESIDDFLMDNLGLYEIYNPNKRTSQKLVKKVYITFVKYWKNCVNNLEKNYVIYPTEKTTTTENENIDFSSVGENTLLNKESSFDSNNLFDNSSNTTNDEKTNNTDREKTITQTKEKNAINEYEKAIQLKKFYLENTMVEILSESIRKMILIDIL